MPDWIDLLKVAGVMAFVVFLVKAAGLSVLINLMSPLLLITIGIFVLWWFTRKKK